MQKRNRSFARLNVDWIYSHLQSLGGRERLLALIAIALVLGLILFAPIFWFSSKTAEREASVSAKEASLKQLAEKMRNYQSLKEELQAIKTSSQSAADFPLRSTLQDLAKASGLSLDQIKPPQEVKEGDFKEMITEVAFEKISLTQLVTFLHKIESFAPLKLKVREIDQMESKIQPDGVVFKVTFKVSTLLFQSEVGGNP